MQVHPFRQRAHTLSRSRLQSRKLPAGAVFTLEACIRRMVTHAHGIPHSRPRPPRGAPGRASDIAPTARGAGAPSSIGRLGNCTCQSLELRSEYEGDEWCEGGGGWVGDQGFRYHSEWSKVMPQMHKPIYHFTTLSLVLSQDPGRQGRRRSVRGFVLSYAHVGLHHFSACSGRLASAVRRIGLVQGQTPPVLELEHVSGGGLAPKRDLSWHCSGSVCDVVESHDGRRPGAA